MELDHFQLMIIPHTLLLTYNFMPQKTLLLIFFICFLLTQLASPQCCQQWNGNLCTKCPEGMHLYRHNCIFDLPNCIEYNQGFDCQKCKTGYRLLNNNCYHSRFNIDIKSIGNFKPYLLSGVQPDPLFSTARNNLQSNSDLWIDWFNYTSLQNHTFMSTSALKKGAESIKERILGSAGTVLHYICTTTFQLNSTSLLIYRLTYQLAQNKGYADLFFVIEPDNNEIAYMEIAGVRFVELAEGSWQNLSTEGETKIADILSKYFLLMNQENFLKGFWNESQGAYNITLFYLDSNVGAVSYTYIATPADLSQIGITQLSDSKIPANNITNPTVQNKTKKQTTNQSSLNTTSTPQTEKIVYPPFVPYPDQTPSANTPNPTTTKPIIPTPDTHPNTPTPDAHPNTHTNKTVNNTQEQFLNISELTTNIMFATGYAVAIQQGYVAATSEVESLSYFPSNSSYCLYFQTHNDNITIHSKFIFYLNTTSSQFGIAYFQQSNNSLLPNHQEHKEEEPIHTNNSTQTNSTNQPTNNKTDNKTISPATNTTTQNKPKTDTTPPTNPTATIYLNDSSMCPELSQFKNVDITNQLKSDLFLPKINLLLITMYGNTLENCGITDAKYSWILNPEVIVSTIRYNITYTCKNKTEYQFITEISNNELKLVNKPENLTETGVSTTCNANCNASPTTSTNINPNSSPTNTTSPTITNNSNSNPINTNSNKNDTGTKIIDNTPNSSTPANQKTTPTPQTINKTINNDNSTKKPNSTTTPSITIIDNIKNVQPSNTITTQPEKNTVQPSNPSNQTNNPQNSPSTPTTPTTPSNAKNDTANGKGNGSGNGNNGNSSKSNPQSINSQDQSAAVRVHSNKAYIPESTYKTDPRYKSIIEIVKSIKRLPSNVSVTEMETWSTPEKYQYFELIFSMPFEEPLPDGSTKKIFEYQVEVNPSSYVTITKTIISYGKDISTDPSISVHLNTSKSALNLKLQNLLGSSYQVSKYTKLIATTLAEHSPTLKNFKIDSLQFNQMSNDPNDLLANYQQTIRFSSSKETYCYCVHYTAIMINQLTGSTSIQEQVEIEKYQLTNCTEKDSNTFIEALTQTNFSQTTITNKLTTHLTNIAGGNKVTINSCVSGQGIFKISYQQSNGASRYAIIDEQSLIVLLLRTYPNILYTPTLNHLKNYDLSFFEKQIEFQMNLTNSVFQLIYVQQIKIKQPNIALLKILAIEYKQLEWGIVMEVIHNIDAIYQSNSSSFRITNTTELPYSASTGYETNYYNLFNYETITWPALLTNHQFPYIMASMQTIYPSFLKDCKILAVLIQNNQSKSLFFSKSYNSDILIKIIVVKEYSASYSATYVITVSFNPETMDVKIKAVEALPANAIKIKYCTKDGTQSSKPICQQCQKGLVANDGECWPSIANCAQNYHGLCIRCNSKDLPFNFKTCLSPSQRSQRQLSIINYFQMDRNG